MQKIIFLHGALGAGKVFDPLINFCREKYTCIAPDLPGHGDAAFEREFSIDFFADHLIKMITDNVEGPVNIFGYSMGGYIALHAATKRPDLFQKIMTLATKFNWTPEDGQKQIAMLQPQKILDKVPKYAGYLSELHHDWQELMRQTAGLIAQLSARPVLQKDALMKLQTDICVGLGDKDNMVTMEETAVISKLCPNGSMYMIPEMQHPIETLNIPLTYAVMQHFFE